MVTSVGFICQTQAIAATIGDEVTTTIRLGRQLSPKHLHVHRITLQSILDSILIPSIFLGVVTACPLIAPLPSQLKVIYSYLSPDLPHSRAPMD